MQCKGIGKRSRELNAGNAALRRLDPSALMVLLVDSQPASRRAITSLLKECVYQVTSKKNSKEALELLALHADTERTLPFDIVLKEHEPPRSNACRLLREFARDDRLKTVPVVVFSSQDDRERVVECLQLGACDYLVKPLRRNELRNLWTRMWRWVTPCLASSDAVGPAGTAPLGLEVGKCDDDEEPASQEGSAHSEEGLDSKERKETSGNKCGSRTQYQSAGFTNASSPVLQSEQDVSNKNAKVGSGSNGVGASTTWKPERCGVLRKDSKGEKVAAVVSTLCNDLPKKNHPITARPKSTNTSSVEQHVGVKRSASEMAASNAPESASPSLAPRGQKMVNADSLQPASTLAPRSTSCCLSDDAHCTPKFAQNNAPPQSSPPGCPPQFAGSLYFIPQGLRPPPQRSAPWPLRFEGTGHPPFGHLPDNTSAPPWADAAMMHYLLGPYNPAKGHLLLQIQLLAEKTGVPPQIILEQVMADSSQLLALMSQSMPVAAGKPPLVPAEQQTQAPTSAAPCCPPCIPMLDPVPGTWKGSEVLPRQQEAAMQQQTALIAEMLRQQQEQQAALLLQYMQLWGLIGAQNNPDRSSNGIWPSGGGPQSLFTPMVPPVSRPDTSVNRTAGEQVDSNATVLERKEKASITSLKLSPSNCDRGCGQAEYTQHSFGSHRQFDSHKREEEQEAQEMLTNGESRPVEETEEMADGGTSGRVREGHPSVCGVVGASQVDQNLDQPLLAQQPYCMLPIGMPEIDPRLFALGPISLSKLSGTSLGDVNAANHGNSGLNSSDSGSNCPDLQVPDM